MTQFEGKEIVFLLSCPKTLFQCISPEFWSKGIHLNKRCAGQFCIPAVDEFNQVQFYPVTHIPLLNDMVCNAWRNWLYKKMIYNPVQKRSVMKNNQAGQKNTKYPGEP